MVDKKIFLFIIIGLFMISMASAFEFDNTYTYNPTTKTATIHNCDFWLGVTQSLGYCFSQGEIISQAKLTWGDTETGVGIDTHVGTFNYTPQSESAMIQDLDLINLKNGKVMTRGKQYKIKVYSTKKVDDYETQCTGSNETFNLVCEKVEIGNHLETTYEWTPLSNPNNNLILGKEVEIGVFVDTKEGDYGDWLPTFSGVQVSEWSSFSASLKVDLVSYYKFDDDEATTTVVDDYGSNTGTLVGGDNTADLSVAGVIETALDLGTTDYVSYSSGWVTMADAFSFSMWVYVDSNTAENDGWFNDAPATNNGFGIHKSTSGSPQIKQGAKRWYTNAIVTAENSWQMITVTKASGSTTKPKFYVNASEKSLTALSDSANEQGYSLGYANAGIGTKHLDEVAIWTRELTPTEVTTLFNSGDGLPLDGDVDNLPTITTPLPANNTVYTTTTTVDFNATFSDDINLVNVSLLIDGTIDQTNTSGTNNSLYTFSKSLSTGVHNWSFIAWDNSTQNTTSETRVINISVDTPTIDLQLPTDDYYSQSANTDFIIYVSDKHNVTNVTLYLDSVANETNTDGTNNTNYTFSKILSEGSVDWYVKAFNTLGFDADSSTWTLNVDLNNPVLVTNITTPIIYNIGDNVSVDINASDTFLNKCWYVYNSATTLFNCTSGVEQEINITSVSGQTAITFYINDSSGRQTSEVVNFNYDIIAPTDFISSPPQLQDLGTNGDIVTLTYQVNDTNLDSCWWNYNGTIIDLNCTSGSTNSTNFTLSNYDTDLTFYANDTLGNQITDPYSWDYMVYYINSTSDATVIVGQQATFTIENYWLDQNYSSINAYVNWNGVRKSLATKYVSGNYSNFTSTFLITGLTVDTNVTFYWEFYIDGDYYNSSTYDQQAFTVKVDDCSSYGYTILNLTMNDELSNTKINASNETGLIEVDLFINSNGDEILQYSNTFNLINPATVCSEIDLTGRSFNYDLDVLFSSTDRVQEFYFVETRLVENANIPANITLMDLLTVDSTSFLFNFFGTDGLPVEDSLVHVYRKYIGDGVFREVEIARPDQNGDTILHLVEEDVIYYFTITQYDQLIFTSDRYTALCQSIPCTINLESSGESAEFPTDWDLIEDGAYSITTSTSSRTATLSYATDDLSTFDFTVYKYNSDGSYSIINTTTSTDTSGDLTLYIPQSAGNVSFFASVERDGEFINSEWVDLETKSQDLFGITLSLFLSALIILTLGLMAVSEGVGTLIYVMLGIALSGFLGLMTLELSTGVNILIYLIIAGGIFLWKLTRGRN